MKCTEIKVVWKDDSDPDLSWLGEYKAREPSGENYIDRKLGQMFVSGNSEPVRDGLPTWRDSRDYRYFVSCNYAHSADKGDLDAFEADYQRMQDYNDGQWSMRCCRAVATIVFQSERGERSEKEFSSGLGGIESDCGIDYEREIEREQIDELRASLKAQNIEVCQ